jgi:hypothetical protein
LDKNAAELARADAAGKAIVATIQQTRVTLQSLADPGHKRYVFRDEAYQAQAPILRRIGVLDLTDIQAEYDALQRIRNSYDAVVLHIQEYLDSVEALLGPADADVNAATLTKTLSAERMALVTLAAFTPDLVSATERLEGLMKHFQTSSHAG